MKETVIRFNDEQYSIKVSVDDSHGHKHVIFHRRLEGSNIDSKFEMFLNDKQYKDLANFLWFLTATKE
jgi:hypothetical protein